MKVAVLKETRSGERRVALVPSSVGALEKLGFEVVVESGAGAAAGFLDEMYLDAGATIAPDAADTMSGARFILKINPPTTGAEGTVNEVGALPKDSLLVSTLNSVMNPGVASALAGQGVGSFALELMPRITRAQSMDILSSQATVAGYKAVLIGSSAIGKFLPMLTTAAGTIRPAKTLVLGAGVAGLQAIATAKRLGSVIEAFDVRPAVKEQVESLGAKFIEAEEEVDAEDEGGYAKELSEDQHKKELELIAAHINEADLTITTAQIPGRKAPVLITEEMVKSMKPGSVIVDLAAETGGNCELTQAGEEVHKYGVTVMGPVNLAGTLPFHASEMWSKNAATFLKEFFNKEGEFGMDWENECIADTCVTFEGEIRHGPTKEKL